MSDINHTADGPVDDIRARHTTYNDDCICRQSPAVHEDDYYGSCVICREYLPHTEDEWVTVPFPCAVARADKAEIALAAKQAIIAKADAIIERLLDERDAAREDADRLAAALDALSDLYHDSLAHGPDNRWRECWSDPDCQKRAEALAAHDALREEGKP